MANQPLPGEQLGKLEALLDRWQTSLDLHARYAALDDARYWHVQPWPKHERPQRWIIQLARKRILALKRLVATRASEGDADFLEGIEAMAFLASLVGLTSVERFLPLATHETERREVLDATPDEANSGPVEKAGPVVRGGAAEAARPRATPVPEVTRPRPTDNRKTSEAATRTGEHRRTAETTRQMPALPRAAQVRREPKREAPRPAAAKPKKAPSHISQAEHVVIADAVRLLGWGKQWHEVAEMISRLAERPAPSEVRRILRTYREHIDAIVARRRD